MKKILTAIILLSAALTSCLKDDTINSVGLKNNGTFIEIPYSGLENFSQSAVLTAGVTDPIILPIVLNVANTNGKLFTNDVTVTLAYDDAARTTYNAQPASPVKYDALPDSTYSFKTKTGIIKAGQALDTVYITFYPDKIDPSKNYMAAISIKDAQGQGISGNFSTVYFHTIGNPIAGNYNQEWIRYNNSAGTGSPAFDLDVSPALFAPIDPTTISVESGTGTKYVVTFTNTAGVLSDFQVSFDPASVVTAGITITSGPKIILADPIAKKYTFNFTYNNSAGSGRNITDIFVKQ